MAKQKSPAYQWYPKDILTDQAVVAMSFEEEGLYRHFLDIAWLEDGLPNDPDALFLLAKKIKSRAVFDRIWTRISKKFRTGRGGKLRNRRQEAERDKQRKRSKERKLAADHRWESERKKRDANASALADANAMQNGCFALSSALASADQDQKPEEPRADRAPRAMARMSMTEARSRLQAAAHLHLDAHPDATDGDVREAVKTAAAKLNCEYDGRGVATIVDAVIGRRARRSA